MNATLPGALFGLCALLCVGLAAEMALPVRDIAVPVPAPAGTAPQAFLPSFDPPPQARFAAIRARPLFNPTRQPFADTGIPSSSVTPPQAVLVGVIISAGRSIAILKPSGGGPAASVAAGEDYQGWRVLRIEPGQVTFRGGQGDYQLPLRPPAARDAAPGTPSSKTPATPQITL